MWRSTNTHRKLREDPRRIHAIWRAEHEALHKVIGIVPTLSYHVARRAMILYEDYPDEYDSIRNIENWQRVIEEAIKHPRADEIEMGVGLLAVHAYDLQKPFIARGVER